jgi:hypothetical protein
MYTIYKYELTNFPKATVKLPRGRFSRILDFGFQGTTLYLWAIVDTACEETEEITFEIYGTGWEIEYPHELKHLKTLHHEGYVWHIFTRNI